MRLARRQHRAGRHADEWFWESYRPWRRQIRIAFTFVVAIMVAGTAALVLLLPAAWQLYAGCTFGALVTLYICAVDSPPEWIERKRRGRDGERRTEQHLRPLERRGWRIVHAIDCRWGDIDHIVVGPPGVFLIETKALTGEASLDDGELVIRRSANDRDNWTPKPPVGPGVKRRAYALREHLLASTRVRWVQGVVVLWSEFAAGVVKHEGIFYVHGTRLRGWLEDQRAGLTAEDVSRVGAYLDSLESEGFTGTLSSGERAA